jgi:amino acid permease
MLLISVIGAISAYDFSLLGRICDETGAKSYRDAWVATVGKSTSWITAFSSTFSCLGANLAYSMILADTFQNLFLTVGIVLTKTQTLLAVTGLVITPLCLLKDLSSLAPFSLLGIMGMVYTAIAMIYRYLDGSYALPAGKFLDSVIAQPSFGTKGASAALSPSSFIIISMLGSAYMAHFNAPKFYNDLIDRTVPKFNYVVKTSFTISIALFCIMSGVGYLTFGASSNGLILNNYSNGDTIMSLSSIAVALSIVFSYPLVFVGTRDGLLDLANVNVDQRSNTLLSQVTLVGLAVITIGAIILDDVSFVLSFVGATLGNALIYVFPALMFRRMVENMEDKVKQASLKNEVTFAMCTCYLGVIMGVIGAGMSIKSLSD